MLRDYALRLRAYIAIEEEEVDLAAASLGMHSTHRPSDSYKLLRAHYLFSCHQARARARMCMCTLEHAQPAALLLGDAELLGREVRLELAQLVSPRLLVAVRA